MPIVNNEDNQVWRSPSFEQENNLTICAKNHVSWGYLDFRKDEPFDQGFQSIPVNWRISPDRKRSFFRMPAETTGR